jgi:hypothetical protein
MAKPFYSIEEVCRKLNKDADGVKALVREGSLREFRDAGKVFFKAEDVDKLAGGGASNRSGTGEITLEPAEDELPTLADSRGGTSIIGLAPTEDDRGKTKSGTVISEKGIGVFDDDELEIDADPMAKTQITTEGAGDVVSLEGTGSGSGLLDLTREADDTSLGAELLDEIYPGEEEAAPAKPTKNAADVAKAPPPEVIEPDVGEAVEPVRVVAVGDPSEGIFAGLMVATLLLLTVAGTVVSGVLQGHLPGYAQWLSANFYMFLGGAAGVVVIALLLGWVIGNATTPRRPA